MSTEITAEKIHKDFYGAEERLFVEAISFRSNPRAATVLKSERYSKIGFKNCKPVKDAIEITKKQQVSEKVISSINYFRTYYPQNKFITEAEVKILCQKYGLLLGDADNYIGDMPDKNLTEIENFRLRKEDFSEIQKEDIWSTASILGMIETQRRRSIQSYFIPNRPNNEYVLGYDPFGSPVEKKSKEEIKKEQPAFKICAPKQDFNTSGYEVVDGFKLVYDPIVLQPVSKGGLDGFLIVTAWGEEASDEIVVNEHRN